MYMGASQSQCAPEIFNPNKNFQLPITIVLNKSESAKICICLQVSLCNRLFYYRFKGNLLTMSLQSKVKMLNSNIKPVDRWIVWLI